MFTLYSEKKPLRITVKTDSEAVRLAVKDLTGNIADLGGKAELCQNGEMVIDTVCGNKESYTVTVNESGVFITGGDALGTVFGIYAFCKECLNINPMYRFNSLFPKRQESIVLDDTKIVKTSQKVRFRGFFINDEDLLSEFEISGGKRKFDYKFYQHVMSVRVLDMILESMLRCELNLVIPSTFLDIMNESEEALIKQIVKRGLYVQSHHIEPMAVSYFAAENYIKEHNLKGEVSFVQNREVMCEVWRAYAKRWAEFKNQVVWQVGLRGKTDVAVWTTDSSVPPDDASRGALIADAINEQCKIIADVTGSDDFVCTSTLWLEASALYGKGHLKLNKNTTAVFSDIGNTQMFGDDFYIAERKPDATYGVYCHTAYFSEGPHLAEGVPPEKMVFSLSEANKYNSLYYAILNVANLREFQFSVQIYSSFLQDPDGFLLENYLDGYFKKYFGSYADLFKKIYADYYDCFAEIDKEDLKKRIKTRFFYHEYGDLPFKQYIATDGALRVTSVWKLKNGRAQFNCIDKISTAAQKFDTLLKFIDGKYDEIPDEFKEYYRVFLHLQTFYLRNMNLWWCEMQRVFSKRQNGEDYSENLSVAEKLMNEILNERKIAATGRFENWYRGDRKMAYPEITALVSDLAKNGIVKAEEQ